jgi:signal transduction histidine kinase
MTPVTRSLTWKLTLAFLSVALTVALLVAVFIRLSSADQLDRLIVEQQRTDLRSALIDYYQTNGSWEGVRENLFPWPGPAVRFPETTHQPGEDAFGGDGNGEPGYGDGFRRDRRELFGLADGEGIVVIALLPEYPLGTSVPQDVLAQGEAIEVDGQGVGTILTARRPPGLNLAEIAFLQRTNFALLMASGGAVLVALLVGVLLARNLTRPLHALTQAAHRMAGGELEQEVSVKAKDEIGELAAAFNRMSREVARANAARRQMTADVAHELRTPLTVIAGYVESMRDGALPPTPERLSVIYAEIERLQTLVGDLRTLSQADAGELKLNTQSVLPQELLQQTASAFGHLAAQKGVRLELKVEGEPPAVRADETRMVQVLSNLVSNALRYTPAGGRIGLGAALEGERVRLTVQDTGPGIAPEDLPLVFERFYRADRARAEDNGESGLGLAIAKAIVEAHGGTVAVHSLPGAGSTFTITLPVQPQSLN